MLQKKSFFGVEKTEKPEFGHAKRRDRMSQKDKKDLQRTLGRFDIQTPIAKLFQLLRRNPRFDDSVPPNAGVIEVKSKSGYSGHHDKTSLFEMCNQ